MARDSRYDSTRRRLLRTGAAVGVGGLLAGCAGRSETSTTAEGTTDATTGAGATTSGSSTEDGESTTEAQGSYSVTMEPVGAVEFESPPETWFPYTADYADMGVALGQADGLSAIGVKARFGSHLYEELPGVSVDKAELTQLWQEGTDKEIFYELDADLHVVDPHFMLNRLQWKQSDVDEIRENVAPFLGNTIFTRVYDWHDYPYYSMYEAFEKLAEVFRERARYEAFERYHDEVLADVQSRLPDETPDVAILYPADVPPEAFYPYLVGDGTQSKHWTDLRVGDALAKNDVTDAQAGGGTVDFETLLEIDPDALAIRLQGEITREYFEREIVSHLKDHPVASDLTAVQDDRVVYGGLTYQGPIIHLFQLERAAQGLYPGTFGGEKLFDRQRVADIVKGDV
ncbi:MULTISPECIES: ABC transporter substrate-binding protein [Halorussus]|uniref:ABC transporter substrate-binding protein n=1 Tax=Halorussus TaxID=1070314 RepID=UPI000E212EFE|nr:MULTISPECIES: ABC transporter substrate-binding protein [Halorussus]NHN61355.1 ABC transporter substrate-binding protein [Halorussus sp. JP-T4]